MHPSTTVSTPASFNGSRYPSANAWIWRPEVIPRSTKGTNCGQAWATAVTPGLAAKRSWYAPEVTVAWVPIRPMRLFRVADTARRTAGRMTSTTGIGYRSRASRMKAAVAVLQAMTIIFTPRATSSSATMRAYSRTCAIVLSP